MLGLPPSRTLDVAGGRFEYLTVGIGQPSIVFINGSGGPMEGWHKVVPLLCATTTTFAYNRPGIGRSTKPARAQTSRAMVHDLSALLAAAAVPQPWVLVGHSFGGLIANLFARLHPRSVGAVLMLEATAPDDVLHLKQHEGAMQKGLAAIANLLLPLNPLHETLHAVQSVAEIEAAPDFPVVPLTVITGSKPSMAWASSRAALELRARHQAALVSLSPLGRHIEAANSGHFPQFSEPALVASAILQLVDAARSARAAAPPAPSN